jgi:putative endonuclease
MFWVCVLENTVGSFYLGQTDDLERRVAEHNDPGAALSKYTRKHGPWRLVWSEEHPDRSLAVRRERFTKSRKSAAWIRQFLLARQGSGGEPVSREWARPPDPLPPNPELGRAQWAGK